MSNFTEFVSIKPLPKNNKWVTTQDFKFYIDDSLQGEYIGVPCGFQFDGCSIPLCIFGPKIESNTISACCLHDYLFRIRDHSFSLSNLIFYRALKAHKVPVFKRVRYWLGVQLFGRLTYFRIKQKLCNICKF